MALWALLDASSHLYEGVPVGLSVGRSVTCFLSAEMSGFLRESHQGSPTLTLNVLNMPMDALLACNILKMKSIGMMISQNSQ